MLLYLNPSDIYSFEVGITEKNKLVQHSHHETGPEDFLSLLIKDLEVWDVKVDNLEAVVVIEGPGSATALRAGVTIANSIGFAKDIPVIGIPRVDGLQARELIEQNINTIIEKLNTKFTPLFPVYGRAAV